MTADGITLLLARVKQLRWQRKIIVEEPEIKEPLYLLSCPRGPFRPLVRRPARATSDLARLTCGVPCRCSTGMYHRYTLCNIYVYVYVRIRSQKASNYFPFQLVNSDRFTRTYTYIYE